MKKKIALILTLCILVMMLAGCSSSYDEPYADSNTNFGNGYFTVIRWWDGGMDYPTEYILYANDTGVMYYAFRTSHAGGITPLYNADGTLQIWEGE